MATDQRDPHRYDDMLELPHHVSQVHPQMEPLKRAAQFAPFSALTGYEDAITEAQRLTECRVELDEDSRELLDEKIRMVMEQEKTMPEVSVTYFVPDEKKEGGAYATVSGRIRKIDSYERRIFMSDGTVISIDEVLDIIISCNGQDDNAIISL